MEYNLVQQLDAFMHSWASPKIMSQVCKVIDIVHNLYLKSPEIPEMHVTCHLVKRDKPAQWCKMYLRSALPHDFILTIKKYKIITTSELNVALQETREPVICVLLYFFTYYKFNLQ